MGSEGIAGTAEQRLLTLRKRLDELGYRQPLTFDSLLLVEQLVADLLATTESLKDFKEVAQKNIEARKILEESIAPYREENARLLQNNNDFHLQLLRLREKADDEQKDLRVRKRELEKENAELRYLIAQHAERYKRRELESAEKNQKILDLQSKSLQAVIITPSNKKNNAPQRKQRLEIDSFLPNLHSINSNNIRQPGSGNSDPVSGLPKLDHRIDLTVMTDNRIGCLQREVDKLLTDQRQNENLICLLKQQLECREREIDRLSSTMCSGRPPEVVLSDCNRYGAKNSLTQLNMQVEMLQKKTCDLQRELKESVSKQHEAMTRAVHLADRNQQLERELKDIDQMALSVEADCNSQLRERHKSYSRVQERLSGSLRDLKSLERRTVELERRTQELEAELECCQKDKTQIQCVLESSKEDRRALTDRINQLTANERDLVLEIDRLTRQRDQKDNEACCSVPLPKPASATHCPKERKCSTKVNKTKHVSKKTKTKSTSNLQKTPCKPTGCGSCGRGCGPKTPVVVTPAASPRRKSSLTKQTVTCQGDDRTVRQLERERDYYRREYECLKQKLQKQVPMAGCGNEEVPPCPPSSRTIPLCPSPSTGFQTTIQVPCLGSEVSTNPSQGPSSLSVQVRHITSPVCKDSPNLKTLPQKDITVHVQQV